MHAQHHRNTNSRLFANKRKHTVTTITHKTTGLVDRRIGERIAIYHQQTGTLLKVITLSHNNDDQITDVIDSTLPTSISIEYTKNHLISYSFSDVFSIPYAYIQSIS